MNKLILGDALDELKKIENNSIDLTVLDPPYKIISGGSRIKREKDEIRGIFNKERKSAYSDLARKGTLFKHNDIKFNEWMPEIYRVMKEGTHTYIMVNDRNVQELLNTATQSGFKLVNILVWKKQNSNPNRYYLKNAEFIIMLRKGGARTINNRGSKSVFEVNNIIGNKLHPTEKPTELLKILIENSSNENDIVLDCFSGSGSTAIACIESNRKYIAIEKDEEYFKIAKKRIEKHIKGITNKKDELFH